MTISDIQSSRRGTVIFTRSDRRLSYSSALWAVLNRSKIDGFLDDGLVIDLFRPGLKYPASSECEFELLTAQHLHNVLEVFRRAQVFVFTLGLTEGWLSTIDNAVFPVCPGTIWGEFDPDRHAFHNFTLAEVSSDLDEFIALAREINPSLRFVLTVSPVPLVATATGDHVLTATIYSKSVLRVAAAEAVRRHADVAYFPAYEIVTGPQAPHDYFEGNRREPSTKAIRQVMGAFLAHCETDFRLDRETSQIALSARGDKNSRSVSQRSDSRAFPHLNGSRMRGSCRWHVSV